MYAAIRQGKAKAGMAEELARTIKEGAIPIISDVPGFKAYYVTTLGVRFECTASFRTAVENANQIASSPRRGRIAS